MDKKSIDTLVDALKYVATGCGILIAMYSAALREYIKDPAIQTDTAAKMLLFGPLLLWLSAVVATIVGVFPRRYDANTDLAKEKAVVVIRASKRFWGQTALVSFLLGLVAFVYVTVAQILVLFPF
jgi:hypothetical protein